MRRRASWVCALTAVMTVAAFAGIYLWYLLSACNNRLRLEDLYGDRSALNDVIVSGTLADATFRNDFRIVQGKIHQTAAASGENLLGKYNDVPLNQRPFTKSNVLRVAADARTESVITDDTKNNRLVIDTSMDRANLFYRVEGGRKRFLFRTGVSYYSEFSGIILRYTQKRGSIRQVPTGYAGLRNVQTGDMNNRFYTYRIQDGRTYLFTRTGADCYGTGGVFDVTDALSGKFEEEPVKEPGTGYLFATLENLAPIDLENGRIQIFGMEFLHDGRMLFLLLIDNEVVFRPFDPTENRFLADIPTGRILDPNDYASTDGLPAYAFTDLDTHWCVELMEYEGASNTPNGEKPAKPLWQSRYLVLETDTLSLMLSCSDNMSRSHWKAGQVAFKGNRLYVLSPYPVERDDDIVSFQEDIRLLVLERTQKLYAGRLLSDNADDRQYPGNLDPEDTSHYRSYYHLAVK